MSSSGPVINPNGVLRCPKCGEPYRDGGGGVDEYGPHTILLCACCDKTAAKPKEDK